VTRFRLFQKNTISNGHGLYLEELDEARVWWKEQRLRIENERDNTTLAIIALESTRVDDISTTVVIVLK
jgi:hypothetical protein